MVDAQVSRRAIYTITMISLFVCAIVALLTRPWRGGDSEFGFFILMAIVSLPAGTIPATILAASGINDWVLMLVGCGVFGGGQWILVTLWLQQRRRVITRRCTRPAVGHQPLKPPAGDR